MKIEQIPKKFEQNLQRAASSHVIIHAGTNNSESASVDELINLFSDVSDYLQNMCTELSISSVVRRSDKQELNEKIDQFNFALFELCQMKHINFINNENILFSNLSRDGLHLNRSGQCKLPNNILQLLS